MKRTFILMGVCVALIGLPHARGQSIGPSTLNATGGTATIGTNICDWSVGEMIMVSTFYNPAVIVTQGLLQNGPADKSGIGNIPLSEHLHVFPNPASAQVNVQYTGVSGAMTYRVVDIAGQVIMSNTADLKQGVTTRQIDISSLAAANYLLEITVKSENNNEGTTSYKIQKLK